MAENKKEPGYIISPELPELIVHGDNLPETAANLRDILAASGQLFERGGFPVLLRYPAGGRPPFTQRLDRNAVVTLAHRLCRPVRLVVNGDDDGTS